MSLKSFVFCFLILQTYSCSFFFGQKKPPIKNNNRHIASTISYAPVAEVNPLTFETIFAKSLTLHEIKVLRRKIHMSLLKKEKSKFMILVAEYDVQLRKLKNAFNDIKKFVAKLTKSFYDVSELQTIDLVIQSINKELKSIPKLLKKHDLKKLHSHLKLFILKNRNLLYGLYEKEWVTKFGLNSLASFDNLIGSAPLSTPHLTRQSNDILVNDLHSPLNKVFNLFLTSRYPTLLTQAKLLKIFYSNYKYAFLDRRFSDNLAKDIKVFNLANDFLTEYFRRKLQMAGKSEHREKLLLKPHHWNKFLSNNFKALNKNPTKFFTPYELSLFYNDFLQVDAALDQFFPQLKKCQCRGFVPISGEVIISNKLARVQKENFFQKNSQEGITLLFNYDGLPLKFYDPSEKSDQQKNVIDLKDITDNYNIKEVPAKPFYVLRSGKEGVYYGLTNPQQSNVPYKMTKRTSPTRVLMLIHLKKVSKVLPNTKQI